MEVVKILQIEFDICMIELEKVVKKVSDRTRHWEIGNNAISRTMLSRVDGVCNLRSLYVPRREIYDVAVPAG